MGFFEELSSLSERATRDEFAYGNGSFSRSGPLSPELIASLLLFMVGDGRRRGYREMLEAFWDSAQVAGIPLPSETPVSAGGFCQARLKLAPGFLLTLLRAADARFDVCFEQDARWRGRRVLAVDGSHMTLQRAPALFRAFGSAPEAHNPQARVSTLINVCSLVPIDVAVDSYQASERHLLTEGHLRYVHSGDVVVLDRGYPGFREFRSMIDKGVDFVARVSLTGTFNAIVQFAAGSEDEAILSLTSEDGSPPLEVRAIRSPRDDGEPVIFVTTLQKADGYTRADIDELYHLRWQAEEHYKAVKADYMAQGQLHAKSPLGVRQEIFAIALFHALSRLALGHAAEEENVPFAELSTKAACLGTSEFLLRLIYGGHRSAEEWARQLAARLARSRVRPRHNRSFPRRSFKPRPKWGPHGRSRA